MPCWTVREILVDLDARGMDRVRLQQAADEAGVELRFVGGKARLTERSSLQRDESTILREVKQSYGRLTVTAGMRRFGFRVKQQESIQTEAGSVLKLRVGR